MPVWICLLAAPLMPLGCADHSRRATSIAIAAPLYLAGNSLRKPCKFALEAGLDATSEVDGVSMTGPFLSVTIAGIEAITGQRYQAAYSFYEEAGDVNVVNLALGEVKRDDPNRPLFVRSGHFVSRSGDDGTWAYGGSFGFGIGRLSDEATWYVTPYASLLLRGEDNGGSKFVLETGLRAAAGYVF